MSAKRLGMLFTVMLFITVIVTGCGSGNNGNKNEASEPIQLNEPTTKPVDDPASVEPSGTATETTKADSGKEEEAGTGFGSHPEGLPKDFPIPDGAQNRAELKSLNESSTGYTVTFDVDKDLDSVSKMYQDYTKDKGYTVTSEMTSDGTYLITGTRNGDSLWLAASESTDESGLTQVAIIYTVPKQ